ncbi:hypothetical protein G9464_14345 [Halostella sp. JP-L12]|uniref:hypothetical protein n=1 Tax=Halostella TaxID=1843185 RepID=UPI000EF7DDD5|nr:MULTISPECIES: hypothetical protein [Halostella]NHN48765.1 hypothetical protein [Halostella sp. JP-L12]
MSGDPVPADGESGAGDGDGGSVRERVGGIEMTRRNVLATVGGGATLGAGKAVDNVLIGYGVLVGENLQTQDLAAVAGERLDATLAASALPDGHRAVVGDDSLSVVDAGGDAVATVSLPGDPADGAAVDADLGFGDGAVEQLVRDLSDLRAGEFEFAFSQREPYFDRVDAAEARPFTTGALRGPHYDGVAPETVEAFAGVDPARPRALLDGLVEAFREYSSYDVPRYLAGSIEDNLLFGAVDLRRYFQTPADFDAVREDDGTGMFCWEFANRSLEALHAVPAHRQRRPVVGMKVHDERHKHMYTGVATAVRVGGELVIPATFVDYTHSTLYDDFHLTGVLGEGLEAYNERHRATDIYWP